MFWNPLGYLYSVLAEPPRVPPLCPYLSSLSMILRAVTMRVGSLLTDIRVLCIITHNCLPNWSDNLITSRKYFSKVYHQIERKRENKAYNDHEFILYDIFLQYDTNVKLQIAVADAYIIVCRTLLGLLVEFKHQIIPGLL